MEGIMRFFGFAFALLLLVAGPGALAGNYEETQAALEAGGHNERASGRYDFVPLYKYKDADDPMTLGGQGTCSDDKLFELSRSVVRLHIPVKLKCEYKFDITPQQRIEVADDSNGCTAWRFSKTLFVTAWHCLPEGKFSCEHASISFDYHPVLAQAENPDFHNSKAWGKLAEDCKEIVYANTTLDVVVFRVTDSAFAAWKDRAVLPALPGVKSFPKIDERVAVLQYPAPGYLGCTSNLTRDLKRYDPYQMEQQVSAWNRGSNSFCRILGRGAENRIASRNASVRWYSGRNPYTKQACAEMMFDTSPLVGSSGPAISILHGCDTCPMSSGSPIISLNGDGERSCTVIGLHTGSGDGKRHHASLNVGLRWSVLGECIDFEATQSQDRIALRNENAAGQPECRAQVPKTTAYLDCNLPENRDRKICEGYVLK